MLVMPFPTGGELYRIKKASFATTYAPYSFVDYVPTQAEALSHFEGALRHAGDVYCKTQPMYAVQADEDGVLDTILKGKVETRKAYRKVDFIMRGTSNERYSMSALDFAARYDQSRAQRPKDMALLLEGLQLYEPQGRIWARELTKDDIATHFPAGHFIASWGSPILVEPGGALVMPFPSGGELYRVESLPLKKRTHWTRSYLHRPKHFFNGKAPCAQMA